MPAKPSDLIRTVFNSVLFTCVVGCSGPVPDDLLVSNVKPPSITISFQDGNSRFPVDTDVRLIVVVKAPAAQGKPHLVATIKKGETIMNSAGAVEPTTMSGDERTYRMDFKSGVNRPGKYEVVVEGVLFLPGVHPAEIPKGELERHVHSSRSRPGLRGQAA